MPSPGENRDTVPPALGDDTLALSTREVTRGLKATQLLMDWAEFRQADANTFLLLSAYRMPQHFTSPIHHSKSHNHRTSNVYDGKNADAAIS